jgi:hypothetical protein
LLLLPVSGKDGSVISDLFGARPTKLRSILSKYLSRRALLW